MSSNNYNQLPVNISTEVKKPLPHFAFRDIKHFICKRAGKYSNINGTIRKKHLYRNEVDIWADTVYQKLKKENNNGQLWMFEVPCCRLNKLYKVNVQGKIPKNIDTVSILYKEYKSSYDIFDQSYEDVFYDNTKDITLTAKECNWLYHRDAFSKDKYDTYLVIDNLSYFSISEVIVGSEYSVNFIKINQNILQYDVDVTVYIGFNWNTITIKFN